MQHIFPITLAERNAKAARTKKAETSSNQALKSTHAFSSFGDYFCLAIRTSSPHRIGSCHMSLSHLAFLHAQPALLACHLALLASHPALLALHLALLDWIGSCQDGYEFGTHLQSSESLILYENLQSEVETSDCRKSKSQSDEIINRQLFHEFFTPRDCSCILTRLVEWILF